MKSGSIVYRGKTKSGKDLLIRYLSKEDIPELLKLMNKISLEKTFILFQGEQLTLKEETKYVQEKLKKIKKNKLVKLLAFVNNQLAGVSDIELKNKVVSHQGSFGIIIDKNFRGDGVGGILMDNVIKEAKEKFKSLKIIDFDVFGDNIIAQNLYKKMGFKKYGLLPKGIKHRDKFVDQILMYKEIR